nr:hypothetical protein [uncultured Rhodopila sp.]
MEPVWGASWIAGLLLITLTTAFHAFGVVMIFRGIMHRVRSGKLRVQQRRHPLPHAVLLIAVVGLLLTVLHGIEAAMWTAAYMLVGAIGSERDAMLYSLDSFTTRGASDILLAPEWRLMGALEAADGMLLFGISTAFVFAIFQRIIGLIDQDEDVTR